MEHWHHEKKYKLNLIPLHKKNALYLPSMRVHKIENIEDFDDGKHRTFLRHLQH